MKEYNYSICFIIPYFGKFNNYFQYWLDSCKHNPTINWILLSDDDRLFDYPDNVRLEVMSYSCFKNNLGEKFGFPINLDNPFKICDFRPAFGYLFQKYLSGYDFWGYCDTDLIWGDIRNFLRDDILQKYAKIGKHGHCVLIKNEKRYNEVFMKHVDGIPDYMEVFSSPLSYCYDEWKGINRLFESEGFPVYWEPIYIDINTHYWNFRPSGSLAMGSNSGMLNGVANYDNGHLIMYWNNNGKMMSREIFYLHLQKRNMLVESKLTDRYSIVPNKFIPFVDVWNNDILKKLSPLKIYFDFYKRRIKFIIGKILKTNPISFYKWGF